MSLAPPPHGSHEPPPPAADVADEVLGLARETIKFPARPPERNNLSCLKVGDSAIADTGREKFLRDTSFESWRCVMQVYPSSEEVAICIDDVDTAAGLSCQ